MLKIKLNLSGLVLLLTTIWFSAQAQTVSTYAGKQTTDPDAAWNATSAPFNDAYFSEPSGIAVDPYGRMYVTEKSKVRFLTGGTVHNRSGWYGDPVAAGANAFIDGAGSAARYNFPAGVYVGPNRRLFIADEQNHAIRILDSFSTVGNAQQLVTFAGDKSQLGQTNGSGQPGSADGSLFAARFNGPTDVLVHNDGTIYVADRGNHTIRKVLVTGVTTLVGKAEEPGYVNASGNFARLWLPTSLAWESPAQTAILFTDYGNSCIRRVDLGTKIVTTVAGATSNSGGLPNKFGGTDGDTSVASFRYPYDLVVVDGSIFVTDNGGNTIRLIKGKNVSTLAGEYNTVGYTDGEGNNARFNGPKSIDFNPVDRALYVTEFGNNVIRKIVFAPEVDFAASNTSVNVNQNVVLTSLVTGNPTSYTWEITPGTYTLKNGSTLNSTDLTVSFNSVGFYTVKLTATNSFGQNFAVKTNYIQVSNVGGGAKPGAAFTVDTTFGTLSNVFNFTDLSSNGPTAWTWEFTPNKVTFMGGTSATSQFPKVQFTETGSYSVKLSVSNSNGSDTLTKVEYITVGTPSSVKKTSFAKDMKIFPNPTSGLFHAVIENAELTNGKIEILDVLGRSVYNETSVNGNTFTFDLSNQPKGIYFISFETDNQKVVKKIQVQ